MRGLSRARLIVGSSPRPGWFQMSADDLLAENAPSAEHPATVRFYAWEPPAVSIGCHQRSQIIDAGECLKRGWDIVRRPTGGRALLHLGDICYCVVMARQGEQCRQLRCIYKGVAEAITEALASLGIGGVGVGETPPSVAAMKGRSSLCLNTRVRGEILVSGRKVAAAAQRLYPDSILQHGSILVSGDQSAIAEVLGIEWRQRLGLVQSLRKATVSLEEILNKPLEFNELVELFLNSFAGKLQLELFEDSWHTEELAKIFATRERFAIASAVGEEVAA